MTIKLPKYMYYPDMKSDVHYVLNYHLDKNKFKGIFTEKEIRNQQEIVEENNTLLKKSRKVYIKENNMKEREELIKKKHKNRIMN